MDRVLVFGIVGCRFDFCWGYIYDVERLFFGVVFLCMCFCVVIVFFFCGSVKFFWVIFCFFCYFWVCLCLVWFEGVDGFCIWWLGYCVLV